VAGTVPVAAPFLHIVDYAVARSEVGMASAVCIVWLIYLIILAVLLSGIAWLISLIKIRTQPFLITKIIGSIICFFMFVIVQIDAISKSGDLFMPMQEKVMFPPRLLVRRPTLDNFQILIQSNQWIAILLALISQTVISVFVFCLIVLPAGYALSKFSKEKDWFYKLTGIGIVISAITFILTSFLPPITSYIQLAFFSTVTSPLMICSFFIVAKSINEKRFKAGIIAGVMISILGSYINPFLYMSNNILGLQLLFLINSDRDFVSPVLITMIFSIASVIATILIGLVLYDSSKIGDQTRVRQGDRDLSD